MFMIPINDYFKYLSILTFILNENSNWASEASPTLGCSIEISRDIYIYKGMSVVCQINCVGRITWPTRMLKVIFGR